MDERKRRNATKYDILARSATGKTLSWGAGGEKYFKAYGEERLEGLPSAGWTQLSEPGLCIRSAVECFGDCHCTGVIMHRQRRLPRFLIEHA